MIVHLWGRWLEEIAVEHHQDAAEGGMVALVEN